MSAADTSTAAGAVRGNVVIGVVSIAVGAVVIPYGAGMPYVREGIPGPGLFPMMIGGLLILFGALLILTSVLAARRERRHADQIAEATSAAQATSAAGAATAAGAASAAGTSSAADTSGAAVPSDADDVPDDALESEAVMDTDIGSDGARRWINGAVLMGSIVFYVLFAEVLGFPITMAIVVFAIVFSLRAKWWVAAATAVLTSLALWAMFEQGLMVQLPDGLIEGF